MYSFTFLSNTNYGCCILNSLIPMRIIFFYCCYSKLTISILGSRSIIFFFGCLLLFFSVRKVLFRQSQCSILSASAFKLERVLYQQRGMKHGRILDLIKLLSDQSDCPVHRWCGKIFLQWIKDIWYAHTCQLLDRGTRFMDDDWQHSMILESVKNLQ